MTKSVPPTPSPPVPPLGPSDILTIIPARMTARRLPDKPLADIGGVAMIVRVWQQACLATSGLANAATPLVACDDPAIVRAIERAGGQAILTDHDLPSGSDRVYQAAERFDPDRHYSILINLQGDMPFIDPAILHDVIKPLDNPAYDLATVAAVMNPRHATEPQIVKVAAELDGDTGRALYFSRAPIPYDHNTARFLHHIGVYAWRRDALARFVAQPPGQLERQEQLEQLRALALGLGIGLQVTNSIPLSVDIPADLAQARRYAATMASRNVDTGLSVPARPRSDPRQDKKKIR